MIRCLVFDCDGVLLDSVPVKTRAFARLAEPYGAEATERFVRYHTEHGGVSRYRKFEWFFSAVLGREITEQELQEWGERFRQISQEELRSCTTIPGARETLASWHGRLPLYVCSGAPQAEQQAVLATHGLDHFFTGIYGAPPAKAELLQNIVLEAGVAPDETLMVGDASTDRDAAQAVGTLFYGVGPLLRGGDHPWGEDLRQLTAFIQTMSDVSPATATEKLP